MSIKNQPEKTLVIGALGQIGRELLEALAEKHGADHLIASDIRQPEAPLGCRFELLDVLDREGLQNRVQQEGIRRVYLLAAILSANGEKKPELAWKINMQGLMNVLETARQTSIERIFWPSSIAVFGPSSPKIHTPQQCVMDPNTVYGISKLAGERWCAYYRERYELDIRSLRYPGLIGYKSDPGGGTTDYAVEIYHEAIQKGHYTAFLKADSYLPMMYMPDAIRATLEVMEAPREALSINDAYNLGGISFSPKEIAESIRQHLPDFHCRYEPDFRQAIADSWPQSIDDSLARTDWQWEPAYDLHAMTADMLMHLRAMTA